MSTDSSAESNSQQPVWFQVVVGNRMWVLAQTSNIAKEYALAYHEGLIPSNFADGFISDDDELTVIVEQVKNVRS